MLIFILSVIIVSFICLCFFKKNFWENRYLVLLISAGVALVATLTTNYFVRGKLETKIETVWKKPMGKFYLQKDSLVVDTVPINYNDDLDIKDLIVYTNDTVSVRTKSKFTYLITIYDTTKGYWKIEYYDRNRESFKYKIHHEIYIAPSSADSVAYYAKKRLYYDLKPTKWLTNMSLPYIKSYRCLYLPPKEYEMIPDTLLRELPF